MSAGLRRLGRQGLGVRCGDIAIIVWASREAGWLAAGWLAGIPYPCLAGCDRSKGAYSYSNGKVTPALVHLYGV